MNPFSLDHIFNRSLFLATRAGNCADHDSLFRGFASQASSTTDSLRYARLVPSSARSRLRSPFPRLSKITLPRLSAVLLVEVWGLEPQTYGLQSHRSSH